MFAGLMVAVFPFDRLSSNFNLANPTGALAAEPFSTFGAEDDEAAPLADLEAPLLDAEAPLALVRLVEGDGFGGAVRDVDVDVVGDRAALACDRFDLDLGVAVFEPGFGEELDEPEGPARADSRVVAGFEDLRTGSPR